MIYWAALLFHSNLYLYVYSHIHSLKDPTTPTLLFSVVTIEKRIIALCLHSVQKTSLFCADVN